MLSLVIALGRLGGGWTRAVRHSSAKRKEIARAAAAARWKEKEKRSGPNRGIQGGAQRPRNFFKKMGSDEQSDRYALPITTRIRCRANTD